MPSAVYLHDGEHQITVTFRTEEDRERFKAHYRALDALAARYRDALVEERERVRVLTKQMTVLDSVCGNEIAEEPENFRLFIAMRDIIRAALATVGEEGAAT